MNTVVVVLIKRLTYSYENSPPPRTRRERTKERTKSKKIQIHKIQKHSSFLKNREKSCHLKGDFFTTQEQEKKTHSSLRAHT